MKLISKILVAITILLSITINAQISNAKTETVKIYGNCGMCKKTIEKAGSIKKIAQVDWNKQTQMATLTYDIKKTNQDEILKRIALSGYDSDKFLAPNDAYNNLHGCCQYDRVAKTPVKADETDSEHAKQSNELTTVFDTYFAVKEALVKTDSGMASTKSTELLSAINAVEMNKLKMDVHMVWMKVLDKLKSDSENISKSNDVAKQRDHFMSLSKNIYELIKASKTETATYYQFCPMANNGKGANWLSKVINIKNPYFGSQMLSCGKTVETIK